jgi:hypothetical protein
VKTSKAQVASRVHSIPTLRFEDQSLTSFAGIVVLQRLFQILNLKARLSACFNRDRWSGHSYTPGTVVFALVIHFMLGFRRLRDRDSYFNDPMVCRAAGIQRMPDVSTTVRTVCNVEERELLRLRGVSRMLVLERARQERLIRLCLDFDGSVVSTKGHAEGSAVGFNRKHKGARSYYPLFCMIAQTGQILDFHHRPGNVHDSNGAPEFMEHCIGECEKAIPGVKLESRMDAAFFDERIIELFDSKDISFTASLPFERFPALKGIVEKCQHWTRIDDTWSYFETTWKPECWTNRRRVVVFRKRAKKQIKGPLQLDLFIPKDYEYQYKSVVTNKNEGARAVLSFHNGRGYQEAIIGEAKQCTQMDLIPCRRLMGNKTVMAASILAHNLSRELQMNVKSKVRSTTPNRHPLWDFEMLSTLRSRIIQRAGRLTRPQRELTLTMNANAALQNGLQEYLDMLDRAA